MLPIFLDSKVVASKKQLITVFAQRNRPKQGVGRAERAQAIGDDYVTVERCAHDRAYTV